MYIPAWADSFALQFRVWEHSLFPNTLMNFFYQVFSHNHSIVTIEINSLVFEEFAEKEKTFLRYLST